MAVAWAASPLRAQSDGRRVPLLPQWEFRAEGVAADAPSVVAGIGINWRAGWYVRPALTLAGGAVRADALPWTGLVRVDAAVRFHLDPFGERPRGLYGSVGASWRHLASAGLGGGDVPILTLAAGVEGKRGRRFTPAVEIGVGGGVRITGVVRRTRTGPAR